ncbi:MAG: rhamnulose-1-phosphate aldolase [Deltaproteobacteria bacterium]|nr:rhamnulose-1-phosphate aldolase [Deltaproteobacteria bacterium]
MADSSFDALVERTARCARDMWLNGWAEGGAGNLSVRVDPARLGGVEGVREEAAWIEAGFELPELGGAAFLMSARGSLFRCIQDRPREGCGVIELDPGGGRYRVIWGFEPAGSPSSEIQSHLAGHAARVRAGDRGEGCALAHVHASNLVALTCALSPDTISITRLLWSLHSECIALFPEGIEVAGWCLPGSPALSRATVRGLEKRRLVLWPFHGVVAAGRSLDEAVGLIETVEKAAGIYLKAAAAGGPSARLGEKELTEIAERFGVTPDPEILGSPAPGLEQ